MKLKVTPTVIALLSAAVIVSAWEMRPLLLGISVACWVMAVGYYIFSRL
ncbi:hypothetical protein GGR92_004807 [Spirosoma lacussanchae]|nr:hypothetical protein [Spirosoma lacussanchae]